MSNYLELGVPDLLRRAKLMRQIHYSRVFPCGASVAIFAAMALEAYPHDLALLLGTSLRQADDPPSLDAASSILEQLEQDRVQIKAKYSILYYVLSGLPMPKGEQPYQDLALLIDVRNQIAHLKPSLREYRVDRMDLPKPVANLLQRVSSRKIIERDLINEPGLLTFPWTMVLDESDTFVEWAVDLVYRVIHFMHDAISDCETKKKRLDILIPRLTKDQLM